jgi:hypothetical protein
MRCTPYSADSYRYPQMLEAQIVPETGGRIYSPYTGETFTRADEVDIEHIVARSEAHDSGLCAADSFTRLAFASDMLNLTLASPQNRQTGPNPQYRGENVTDPPGYLNHRDAFDRCPVRPCMLQPSLHLGVGRTVDRHNETAVSLPNDSPTHNSHISAGLQMFEISHNW